MQRRRTLITLLLGMLLTLSLPGQAQHFLWGHRYEIGPNQNAKLSGMVVDKLGNVFVAGMANGAMVTIKYDKDGNWLWGHSRQGPSTNTTPIHIALDSHGNVCVAGFFWDQPQWEQLVTLKYDTDGHLLWKQSSWGLWYCSALTVTCDAQDNVYVVYQTGVNLIVVVYTPDGQRLWDDDILEAPGYLGSSWAGTDLHLAVDGQGNVFIGTTFARSAHGKDYYIAKVGTSTYYGYTYHSPRWQILYNGLGDGDDVLHDLKLDASGNVYVTGSSATDVGTDMVTIKYDTNGNMLWGHRYNGLGNADDSGNALAVDQAGNVYVTGSALTNTGTTDCVTIKYDTDGNWQWGHSYNGPANATDTGEAITLDQAGNIYVSDFSQFGIVGGYTKNDCITLKYDTNGNWQWGISHYGVGGIGWSDATFPDAPVYLAVDASGNIYVAGTTLVSENQITQNFITIKYSPDPR